MEILPTEFLDLVIKFQKPGMVAAEIGVAEGNTTEHVVEIIKKNKGKLYAVDWFMGGQDVQDSSHQHGYDSRDASIKRRKDFFCDRITKKLGSKKNFEKYVELITENSFEAAKKIPDESLDICFIDAGHGFGNIMPDIILYFQKVKMGGVIAGHDYDIHHPDVVYAVNYFFGEENVMTWNYGNRAGKKHIASWWLVKDRDRYNSEREDVVHFVDKTTQMIVDIVPNVYDSTGPEVLKIIEVQEKK